jgi:hypothetical protein
MIAILVPLYGALIGWFAVYLPFSYLRYSKRKEAVIKEAAASLFKTAEISKMVESKLDNDLFDAEIEELIDQKLDDLVIVFKQQIPMASTFLVGNLVEKLKASAKNEIIKMVPDMKGKLMQRAKRELDPDSLLADVATIVDGERFERYFLKFCTAGAGVGLGFGALQLAMMHLFG